MKILRYIWLSANAALSVLVLVACIAPYISPDTNWLPGVLSLFFLYLVMAQLFFMVTWWLSSMPSWSLLSVASLIPGIPHYAGYFQPSSQPELLEDNHIWVASYNLQDLQILRGQNKQKAADLKKEIARYITQYGTPDIFCVQDYSNENESFIKKYLPFKYRHLFTKQRVKTGIFSRYPILNKGEIRFKKSYNSCVWADLKIGEDTMRVYSLHLESNRITDDTEDVLAQQEVSEELLRSRIKNMLRKYKNSAAQRVHQSEQIAAHIDTCPHPVVVCGDLNDIPLSRAYRVLKGARTDAFRAKGKGFGTTYAGGIPGLRIDYIFVSDYWQVMQHEVMSDKAFSDHYAIIARIKKRIEK